MASSLDMSLDDRIKNRSNRGRARGRGRARSGRGASGTLGGGRMNGTVNGRRMMTGAVSAGRMTGAARRGPLMVNARPSSYAIAKASSKTWTLIHVLEILNTIKTNYERILQYRNSKPGGTPTLIHFMNNMFCLFSGDYPALTNLEEW
ncbi:hypothetical protein Ahy_A03g011316 isoform D [Arachis hypogaea]|uniref:Uncharacterized protein n=1 Tax=Arachis hypogaea TaxID=3818 RepID=A0A445DQD2_ARAHY|nr:hypothetical protein Ahy_A03g011316 isoform D [Arachis hypogaea]